MEGAIEPNFEDIVRPVAIQFLNLPKTPYTNAFWHTCSSTVVGALPTNVSGEAVIFELKLRLDHKHVHCAHDDGKRDINLKPIRRF